MSDSIDWKQFQEVESKVAGVQVFALIAPLDPAAFDGFHPCLSGKELEREGRKRRTASCVKVR